LVVNTLGRSIGLKSLFYAGGLMGWVACGAVFSMEVFMTWWQAVVLGVVEGVTEYLPVSSTGHLILAQRAMGILNSDAANAYAICIQGGAILAVLTLYYGHVKRMGMGLLGRDDEGKRLAGNLFVAAAPLVGMVVLEKLIKGYLFGLWPVIGAWFVGGVGILVVEGRKAGGGGWGAKAREGLSLQGLTWRMALVIGGAQCLAAWPGMSRSLMTIVAGVLVGLSLPAAVEFSFLLGVVALGGATVKDGVEYHGVMVAEYGLGTMALGFGFAFVSAVGAVKWMVGYLNRNGLALFGYYRVALSVGVAALILAGVLKAPGGP
jgi:undecaprenyl-diphosphatase